MQPLKHKELSVVNLTKIPESKTLSDIIRERPVYHNERNLARFLLFSFAKNPKLRQKEAEGRIKIVDPNGNLAVVSISVESKKYLPGAVAQDVLTALIDMYTVKNRLPIDELKERSESNPVVNLTVKNNTAAQFVFTQKKDLMVHMGKHEKNSKYVVPALNELLDTKITLKGCYYKIVDGKTEVEAVTHTTNYIQSFTEKEKWREGTSQYEGIRVQLDPVVISNLLSGYVATIDKSVWL